MRPGFAIGLTLAFAYAFVSSACSTSNSNANSQESDAATDVMLAPDTVDACAPRGAGLTCSSIAFAVPLPDKFGPPVAHQNVCSSSQVADLLASCFPAEDAGDGGPTCAEFLAANAPCAVCAFGSTLPDAGDGVSVPAPPLEAANGYPFIEYDTCAAALSAADPACKLEVAKLELCAQSACSECGDPGDFTACDNYQLSSPPSTGGSSACGPILPNCNGLVSVEAGCIGASVGSIPQSEWESQCGTNAATFVQSATVLLNTICGP